MKTIKRKVKDASKARTGIEGFDQITEGGLPRGRTTLLEGGPGSGKTIMAIQSLVNGARLDNEAGIFVAFEESSARIMSNAGTGRFNITQGAIATAVGIGASLSQVIAGSIAHYLGNNAAFLFLASVAVAAFLILFFFMPETRDKKI